MSHALMPLHLLFSDQLILKIVIHLEQTIDILFKSSIFFNNLFNICIVILVILYNCWLSIPYFFIYGLWMLCFLIRSLQHILLTIYMRIRICSHPLVSERYILSISALILLEFSIFEFRLQFLQHVQGRVNRLDLPIR